MLVYSRRVGETVVIDNGRVVVHVDYIDRGKVKLSFRAARDVPINRGEVQARIDAGCVRTVFGQLPLGQ